MLATLLTPDRILLDLGSSEKEAVLAHMVAAFGFEDEAAEELLHELTEREAQGATNVGHGVAIPHVRSGQVETVRLGYGRRLEGIEYGGDGPVRHVFMIIAPPIEIASGYLKVLAAVAKFVRDQGVRDSLARVATPDEVLRLMEAHGA